MKKITELIKQKTAVKTVTNDVKAITNYYYCLRGWDKYPKEFWRKNGWQQKYSYARNMADAKNVYEFFARDVNYIMSELYSLSKRAREQRFDWRITTILKRQ